MKFYSLNLFVYTRSQNKPLIHRVATKLLQNKYIYIAFPFSNICTKLLCIGHLWLMNGELSETLLTQVTKLTYHASITPVFGGSLCASAMATWVLGEKRIQYFKEEHFTERALKIKNFLRVTAFVNRSADWMHCCLLMDRKVTHGELKMSG